MDKISISPFEVVEGDDPELVDIDVLRRLHGSVDDRTARTEQHIIIRNRQRAEEVRQLGFNVPPPKIDARRRIAQAIRNSLFKRGRESHEELPRKRRKR